MKLSELIAKLQDVLANCGDTEVQILGEFLETNIYDQTAGHRLTVRGVDHVEPGGGLHLRGLNIPEPTDAIRNTMELREFVVKDQYAL